MATEIRCQDCGFTVPEGSPVAERIEALEGLIKALCSDPSPFGSDAFRRVRDTVNQHHRALLLEVLR